MHRYHQLKHQKESGSASSLQNVSLHSARKMTMRLSQRLFHRASAKNGDGDAYADYVALEKRVRDLELVRCAPPPPPAGTHPDKLTY